MSNMQETESIERFTEGIKKAASRARSLAALGSQDWLKVSTHLEMILLSGQKIFRARAMSRQETLEMLDKQQGKAIN